MTASRTQSVLHASKSLLCIRNARHLAIGELLPNGLGQNPQSPHQLMTILRSSQKDVGK